MAREMKRLTALAVRTMTKHGRHSDGGGLYLSISPNGGKRWTFLYRWRGKPTEIGLGSARDGHVTLAQAREEATKARAMLAERPPRNPKDDRRPVEGATFGEVADRLIDARRTEWRNEKSAAAWELTLGKYCVSIRRNPVADLTVEHMLEVLGVIWRVKPETTRAPPRPYRDEFWMPAKAQGLRFGENPARWKGNRAHLLPKRQRLARGHHAAMPYEDVAGFMSDLRASEAFGARAFEFAILTTARTGEVLGARWSEIDIDRGVWTVPVERMKAGREHRAAVGPGVGDRARDA